MDSPPKKKIRLSAKLELSVKENIFDDCDTEFNMPELNSITPDIVKNPPLELREQAVKNAHREHAENINKLLKKSADLEEDANPTKAFPKKYLKTKWFNCDDCNFKTQNKAQLKAHVQSRHTPEDEIEWFECDECQFKTKTKQFLKQHTSVRHTKFECSDCTFVASSKIVLKNHEMSKHTEDMPSLECDECSFKTKNKKFFKNHVSGQHRK